MVLAISLIMSSITIARERVVLDVALINEDRYPYFIQPQRGSPENGVYIELLNQIGEMNDIEFKFKFFPQLRVRHLMKYQKVDVEPGIAKEWRTEELEIKNSIYSIPLFKSSEVIIYRKSLFDIPPSKESDFSHLTSCSVLGFHDVNISNIDKDITTEVNSAKMVDMGRCDYMLMPLDITNSANINRDVIGITPTIKQFDLTLRLTKKNANLLPKINQTIQQLVDDGYIEDLFNKYQKYGEDL